MSEPMKNNLQRFCLKKKMPKGIWLQSAYAIQFDGSFACIARIADVLGISAKMDRHDNHKPQCRLIFNGIFDIFIKKNQWVVWNKSILPLKEAFCVGHLVWDDDLFTYAYRKTRKVVQ